MNEQFALTGHKAEFFLGMFRRLFICSFPVWGFALAVTPGPVANSDGLRLECSVQLPNQGKVRKKRQIWGPEISTPRYSGSGESVSPRGESLAPGGLSQPGEPEANRGGYEEVDMEPLVFLQRFGNPRHCLAAHAPGGFFTLEELPPGNYKLTVAIPGLGFMERDISIPLEIGGREEAVRLRFDFEPSGQVVEPVARKEISGPAVAAFTRGAEEFRAGNLAASREEFAKAVKLEEVYAEAWEYLGIIERRDNDLTKAADFFSKTLAIDPNSCWALQYLGTIYLSDGEFEKSRELFERAVLLNPEDPYPRVQLGKVLYLLQELSRALDHLVKARALDPRHFTQPQIITAEVFRVLKDRDGVYLGCNPTFERFLNHSDFIIFS